MNTKYLDRLFRMNSLEEFGKYRLFPNAKEVTEAVGILDCIETHLIPTGLDKMKGNVDVFVIGDGVVPRLGAFLAFTTKWNITSIDPQMREADYSAIQRLSVLTCTIEQLLIRKKLGDTCIIILPHSHANAKVCWDAFDYDQKWLIKLECCTKDVLDMKCMSYRDGNMLTKANKFYIWNNYLKLKYDI